MKSFDTISFKGTFRDYQQKILSHTNQYLQDNKIHIVAAPGSGKTILGLELIRKIGKPALIFSPTVVIRQQWGERFSSNFIPEGKCIEEFMSYDLKSPGLLTSVTYQALHAAVTKGKVKAVDDEEVLEEEQEEDFSDFRISDVIVEAGIGTICLDEAHHLRSEWQKALEDFVKALPREIKILSLTATPPYDSTPAQWDRYISLCGEIDEEIFVPQLVAQKTLCPHQDFIYFNYPTKEETRLIRDYKKKSSLTVRQVMESGYLTEVLRESNFSAPDEATVELMLEYAREVISLFCMMKEAGIEIPQKSLKLVSPSGKLPKFGPERAEIAFQFILSHPEIFSEKTIKRIHGYLMAQGLMEKKRVRLLTNEKINKQLITSAGKLNSIARVVEAEKKSMGNALRMVILTDYIRKESVNLIGNQKDIVTIGAIPIFEIIRRSEEDGTKVAVVTGTIVILPGSAIEEAKDRAKVMGISMTLKILEDVPFYKVDIQGSNKNKVKLMTELFESGAVQILIGTKSLLGEGWDSPCINSLILASFVGSFMLSNQMRGRAIRVDQNLPDKVSNIWHLVTLEPEEVFGIIGEAGNGLVTNLTDPPGEDFALLKRRFNCFLGPAYEGSSIESGMERINILRPPYTKNSISDLNAEMTRYAADRNHTTEQWEKGLGNTIHSEVLEVCEIPVQVQPTGFLYYNIIRLFVLSVILGLIEELVPRFFLEGANGFLSILLRFVLAILFLFILQQTVIRCFRFRTPNKSIESLGKCLYKALRDIGEITSEQAQIQVEGDAEGTMIYCALVQATAHEKQVFSNAIREMLSPIENPRYLFIKEMGLFGGKFAHRYSYSCPSVLGRRKEDAAILDDYLKRCSGGFLLVYTRSEKGRKELLRCRRYSYLKQNSRFIGDKKVLDSKWD